MPSKSDLTKQRIVQAANQLFYRKGFSQTSFSDVVAEADVPAVTFITISNPRKRFSKR